MRFHSNRVIEYDGEKAQIRNWPNVFLKGRRHQRNKYACWRGIMLYFTSVKRVTKTGRVIIVYQVSNYKALACEHVQNYGYRWGIEMFFRTANNTWGSMTAKHKNKLLKKTIL